MKRISKKLAAFLLVAVMVVSLFPLSALAEDAEVPSVAAEQTVVQEEGGETVEATVPDVDPEAPAEEQNDSAEDPIENQETPAETPVVEEPPAVEETPKEEPVVIAVPVPAKNTITSQPEDVVAAPGSNAVFTVGVNGTVKKIQWQYSANGWKWKNLSNKAELTVKASNSWFTSNNGYKYRCVVTFRDKTEVISDEATLFVSSKLSFKTPTNSKTTKADVKADAPAGTFPEGTSMDVIDVDAEDYIEAINSVLPDATAENITAVDISFEYDGEGIEPANGNQVTVVLKSDAIKEGVKLVHVDDNGVATEVDEDDIESIEDGEIIFRSDAFSVYAVVEGDVVVTDTITYHFLDGEGNPYPFLNKAGQTVTEQIIKDGESLQAVPAPGLLGENAFNGWYYFENGEYGEQVEFDIPISVTETKDVYIKAHYGDVIYVTFWQYAAGKVVLERRQVPADEDGKYRMDLSSVTVPAPKTTLKFMGWSLTHGSDASEEDGDTPGSRALLPNTTNVFTEDTNVYPVYYSGLWVVFVSAGTGMGASYVESYFLPADSADAFAAEPADPTMTGYAFDGWYTVVDDNYTTADSDTTKKFDFNTSFDDLAEYTNERGEVVLYGHWKGGTTTYVVVYWKQQVDNDKNATTHAQKTYAYAGQTNPIPTTTGANLTPRNADTSPSASVLDTVGFQYANYYDAPDGSTTVTAAADGSSLLNVYFDRQLVYFRFRTNTNATYNGNWTSSNYATTYTGLYGQTWAQAGYTTNWPVPSGNNRWGYYNSRNGTTGMSYLGQFIPPEESRGGNDVRFYYNGSSTYNVNLYLQNTDGSWPSTTNISGRTGGTFNLSDKLEGYVVSAYRVGNNGNWTNVTYTTNSDGTHNYTPSTVSTYSIGNGPLNIRYARLSYEIKYLNPLNENSVLDSKTLLFGSSLSSAKPSSSSEIDLGVPGYEWDGKWYKDKNCTVEFNFDTETMPLGGIKVYAGKTPLYFYIKIDPNGGQLMTNQSTWRWVLYGDDSTYTYDNIERNYIDYKGSGTAYYYYYDEFEEERRDDIWNYQYMSTNPRTAYYTSNTVPDDWDQHIGEETVHHNGSEAQAWLDTNTKYSYEADAYSLIGWYDITDGEANMKPFKTGTVITRDTVIQAQWRRTGEYRVVYSPDAVDENGNPLLYPEGTEQAGTRVTGANTPTDTAKYADQSDSSIMDKMGAVPAGYNFVGWYYNDKVYDPGEVFQVLASLSDDNKIVYLYPVLEPVDTLPVEVIDITFDPNGGQFTDTADTEITAIINSVKGNENETYAPEKVDNADGTKTINNLKLNEAFNLLSAASVERGVIIDGEMVPGRGYRLKEWNTKADGTGTSFALDTKVGVDDKTPVPNTVYAIWEPLFYVCHSSDGSFDTISLESKNIPERWAMTKGFDAAGTVNKTQYTDWYYGGFAVYAAGDVKAEGLTFEAGDVKSGTIASTYWTRAKAAKNADLWDTTDVGAVYYLKEVPTDYLAKPVAVAIRDEYGAGDITSLHFLSVTDTNIYREGGIKLKDTDTKGTFAKNFKLTQNNGSTTTITATSQFKLDGYLTVVNNGTENGEYTACQAFWTTYDNVKVYGIEANIKDITLD